MSKCLGAVGFAILAVAQLCSGTSSEAAPRQSVPLNTGWRFIEGEVAGAEKANYADSSWSIVAVPHTWNRVGYYKPNPEEHINRASTINKRQGVSWYRLSFKPPPLEGRRAWLEFDAASRMAEVWLNGVRLGEHLGGFSRFRFDATNALKDGATNVLAVRVDSSQPGPGTRTVDVLPYTGDFFVHGGLYRPVRLIFTDPVHIDMADFGGPGIYAKTPAISRGNAAIEITSKLRNDTSAAIGVALLTELVDRSGRRAAQSTRHLSLKPGALTVALSRLTVVRPRLWRGTADPYLYTLRAELRASDGRLLDSLDQQFGIRSIRLDPARGFFLNGKQLRLHGVGFHQDFEGKGWAQSEKDVAESFSIIREMGANTIRLTHYQHGQAIHELADQNGFVLWDEIPLVTAWTHGQQQSQPTPGLIANAKQQLEELIHQNYNHPSVAVWSIANEVDFGSRPPGVSGALKVTPDPMPLLHQLSGLARAEDPTRPTVLANCCDEVGSPDIPPVADAVDAAGANRYFGWYYRKPQELAAHLDRLHRKRPSQPLAVTEYGAGAATTIHTDNPQGGPIDAGGVTQPEEYQSWLHEQTWPTLARTPFLWATWLWNAFDFASTVRHEGDSQDINTKGLVTYDRKTRKDAYYFYKANWTSTPTVYITSRRYVDRAYLVTDVHVYSNALTTILKLNGASLGRRTNCTEHVCTWSNVRLQLGSNRLDAFGKFGARTVQDSVTWRLGPDAARSYRIDSGSIVGARSQFHQFGSDTFFDGGKAATVDLKTGAKPPPVEQIKGSPDQNLLATFRIGDFHYRIPAGSGRYRLTLSFIEPGVGGHSRSFNVLADGKPILSNFDILAAAGAPLTLVRRSFELRVSNDMLDLYFQPVSGEALVSAIELERQN